MIKLKSEVVKKDIIDTISKIAKERYGTSWYENDSKMAFVAGANQVLKLLKEDVAKPTTHPARK